MGTHISKVKSIDLDIWQPEQMDVSARPACNREVNSHVQECWLTNRTASGWLQSMKKWGNRRANLYWEAYLKAGHHPPDQ